ncbi:pre-rRNA processing protein [Vanrija albida]|uniref:Pre-rRNA processing protein n=1 Tax=Vanrija albida TaxID=181172 RepID=A0ABR3PXA1_9TREE
MPDAFFQSQKKRKRPNRAGGSSRPPARKPRAARDEELGSDEGEGREVDIDDMDFTAGRRPAALDDDEFVDTNETAAEKRVRLARGYLDKVKQDIEDERAEDDYDAAEIDKELIASRLRQEVDEAEGRIHRFVSSAEVTGSRFASTQHVPTGVALTATGRAYVSTKNGSVLEFDRATLKSSRLPGGEHKGAIYAVAASEDGKWVVTGGADKLVGVWRDGAWVAGMRGHKDAVSSVVFPPLGNASAHVLSASLGRHLALHSLSTLSALDTFFGHQDAINSVSALKPTAAVTAGGRDRTCRWWKVEEEVQLVLRSGGKTRDGDREYVEGSVDVVCALDDSHFVSGGDTGTICLWSTGKKKPIYSKVLAHGTDTDGHNSLVESSKTPAPRWVTALAALRGTNLFASGSWDGWVRLWVMDAELRTFKPAGEFELGGFINALQILQLDDGIVIAAAVGREPRLGRWISLKSARNGLFVASLDLKSDV